MGSVFTYERWSQMEVQLQHFVKRGICLTMSPIKWNKAEKLRLYIMLSFIFFSYYVILQLLFDSC